MTAPATIAPPTEEEFGPTPPGRSSTPTSTRPPASFAWGSGSDDVSLFPERTPEEAAAELEAAKCVGPDRLRRRVRMDHRPGGVRGPRPPPCLPARLPGTGPRVPGPQPGAVRHRPGHGGSHHPRPRHRRGEGGLPPQDVPGGPRGLPAVQRAGGRLRPGLAADPGGPGRRRVGGQRPEGVDLRRPDLRHRRDPLPHRPRPPQAPRADRLRGRHARPGGGGPPAPADDRRRHRSTRSSSPRCGSPTPTDWAR